MESDDDVSLFYTQSLIAECKNEDFGEPDTTTLFPLDPDTLDNICRVNIPGVPLTKYGVDPGYSRHGFNQCLSLHTGADLNSLEVNITQCCSHYNALRAMDEFIDDRGSDSVYALKCEGLGNHAVEIECTDSSVYERCTVAIWVRWTTAIEIRSSGSK